MSKATSSADTYCRKVEIKWAEKVKAGVPKWIRDLPQDGVDG